MNQLLRYREAQRLDNAIIKVLKKHGIKDPTKLNGAQVLAALQNIGKECKHDSGTTVYQHLPAYANKLCNGCLMNM